MGTSLVAPYLASKREKIERGDYAAEFPLQWMQKYLHLALPLASGRAGTLAPVMPIRPRYPWPCSAPNTNGRAVLG